MYLKLFIYVFLFLVIIFYIYHTFHKQIYIFALKNFITPKYARDNKYFIDNFSNIISPYFKGDIPVTNKSININRNVKNEYSLTNQIYTKDLDLNKLYIFSCLFLQQPKSKILISVIIRIL